MNAPYDHAGEEKVPQRPVFTVCEAEAIHEARLAIEQARERLLRDYIATSSTETAYNIGTQIGVYDDAELLLERSIVFALVRGKCINAATAQDKWRSRRSVTERLNILVAPSEV